MNRKHFLRTVLALAVLGPVSALAAPIKATLYKDPSCSCCQAYANYLDQNGFKVKVIPDPSLEQTTLQAGIPQSLIGCHLTKLGGYVFEGHIPAPIIKKYLASHPTTKGLAIPGMPSGLPGMPAMAGMPAQPIQVYVVGTPKPVVFATVNQ
jgi:hypothetical protein